MPDKPIYQDPDYVQGQIAALQALILGLAKLHTSHEFREQSLEQLETLKTALLTEPVSDAKLLAIDECIDWVSSTTS